MTCIEHRQRDRKARESEVKTRGEEFFPCFACPVVSWAGRNWYRVLNSLVPCSQHKVLNASESEKGALNTLWVTGANVIEIESNSNAML